MVGKEAGGAPPRATRRLHTSSRLLLSFSHSLRRFSAALRTWLGSGVGVGLGFGLGFGLRLGLG